MMDWKDALGAMLADPSLPEGEELVQESPEKKKSADRLHIFKEKKGRKGKTAIIVEGFSCSDEEVAEIAAWLKRRLGVGGSARGGEILIQGDLADKVSDLLREKGYRV